MSTGEDPIVDQWYQQLDKDQQYKVIALDDTAGTVEIQYLDGEIEEMDIDDWYQLNVETMEAPEEVTDTDEKEDVEEEEEEDDWEEEEEDDDSSDEWDDDYKDEEDDWGKEY